MSDTSKSYRIRTNAGQYENDYITIPTDIVQNYDTFDILSVSITNSDTYRLHNSNYGIIVGRVIANNGFGVPNAKISVFVANDGNNTPEIDVLYPFRSVSSKDSDGVRYNLLPDNKVSDCHQVVGTFPNKRYALDNNVILEVFDKYYKYTTRTNNSGDYMICGVPTGSHTLHMDLDVSDCGILSQRPRDFVYKGYTIEQFEAPNMFKDGTNYSELSQIFTQDQSVNVYPFWGNSSLEEIIGITRADINIAFKFEPTCVFIGSVISDNSSNGISKKCIATPNMGAMDELVTGEGKIEMIRKTPGGDVEEFFVKGTQVINGDGVWCYQIPMNLDYMTTDEYGNMVPTDNPEKGIPTRARVRFRVSMQDNEENIDNYFRPKVLVPNNPEINNGKLGIDYEFGTYTDESSFRDLFWNNVYSVKSYIPRFQKKKINGWKNEKFTGIKHCNIYGGNNPMPYNNIRIKLPLMFTILCVIIKTFIYLTGVANSVIALFGKFLYKFGRVLKESLLILVDILAASTVIGALFIPDINRFINEKINASIIDYAQSLKLSILKEGLCPDLENWYFSPLFLDPEKINVESGTLYTDEGYNILRQTYDYIGVSENDDATSIDDQYPEDTVICLTTKTDYLLSCIEMNLAQEYKVINFDFYNDWVNGTIYIPRFMRYIRPKKKFLGIRWAKAKVKGCMEDTSIFAKTRRYTQQCSIGYKKTNSNGKIAFNEAAVKFGNEEYGDKSNYRMHKKNGLKQAIIFGKKGGVCHEQTTSKGQFVYYMKPCEKYGIDKKVNLFATDLILLGSLNDCDSNGIPQSFKFLTGSSYIMPTNLALTNMESDGELYSTDGKTICGKGNHTSRYDAEVNVLPEIRLAKKTLGGELEYFSGGNTQFSTEYDVNYDEDEDSDTIAMTEAAGIAWNYTGPGQGTEDRNKMYFPGGHFIGMSCVNSITNIKSCINLERICEVGSSISQRKEDITKFDESGNPTYVYTVPSGFISENDIVDENFRAMFSTMNRKRLIASKTNPDTGYKMYDFSYLNPNGFNGSFSKIVGYGDLYNNKITAEEENLTRFNISRGSSRSDYDPNESAYTQTRTIEDLNYDYYLFRFGLNYDALKREDVQSKKFLIGPNNSVGQSYMYLPQTENSFYFYFGMKQGATAIDEFNKQFFSVCEKDSIMLKGIHLYPQSNMCDGNGEITVVTNGIETPYSLIEYYSDINDIHQITDGEELNLYTFTLTGLTFGTYTVIITDLDGVEYRSTATIGLDGITFESEEHEFNVPASAVEKFDNIFGGGYIRIWNINIEGIDENSDIIVEIRKKSDNSFVSSANTIMNANYENAVDLYVDDSYTYYSLLIKYQCPGHDMQGFSMKDFYLLDGREACLAIGNDEIYSINVIDGENPVLSANSLTWWFDGIWDDSNGDSKNWLYRVGFFNEIKNYGTGETETCLVHATRGDKVLWGSPQNISGIHSSCACTEDYYSSIEPGYDLNDDYIYYPTYGINHMHDISQYSSIAHNGRIVCGMYHGLISGGTLVMTASDRKYYHTGYGYVYKSLPDGELRFYIKTPDTGMSHPSESMNGVFYPTFIYPSMKRPFAVNAEFYKWEEKFIRLYNNGNSQSDISASLEKRDIGEKFYTNIINGITYNQNFGDSSYIYGYSGETISASENDLYCLSATSSNIRKTQIEGFPYVEEVNSFSYEITEGYDSTHPERKQMVKTISDNVSPNFFFSEQYYVTSAQTILLKGIGYSDEDITYYPCVQRPHKIGEAGVYYTLLNNITNNYIYSTIDDLNYYLYCLEKTPDGTNDIIVKVICQFSSAINPKPLVIEYGDNIISSSTTYSNINDLASNIWRYNKDLEAYMPTIPMEFPIKYEGDMAYLVTWREAIDGLKIDTGLYIYSELDKIFVVGIYDNVPQVTGGNNRSSASSEIFNGTRVAKIYPYTERTYDLDIEEPYLDLELLISQSSEILSAETITPTRGGVSINTNSFGNKEYTIGVRTNQGITWNISTDGNIDEDSIDNRSGVGNGRFSFKMNPNNTSEEVASRIVVNAYGGQLSETVTINQSSGITNALNFNIRYNQKEVFVEMISGPEVMTHIKITGLGRATVNGFPGLEYTLNEDCNDIIIPLPEYWEHINPIRVLDWNEDNLNIYQSLMPQGCTVYPVDGYYTVLTYNIIN